MYDQRRNQASLTFTPGTMHVCMVGWFKDDVKNTSTRSNSSSSSDALLESSLGSRVERRDSLCWWNARLRVSHGHCQAPENRA